MSRAVILMYHRIGEGVLAGREAGEHVYAVARETFAEHVEVVARSRSAVVSMDEIAAAAAGGPRLPPRALAFTFDDGNASDHADALPLLLRRGYSATFFVTPAWTDSAGYMTWSDLRTLAAAGMTVGAHGLDHTRLSTLDEPELRRHLREARRLMQARLGRPPRYLSLPGGAGDRRVVWAARQEGFALVADSTPRRFVSQSWPDAVPRFAVRRGDKIVAFRALVEHHPVALIRHAARHGALTGLRAVVGDGLYRRVRRGLVGGEEETA